MDFSCDRCGRRYFVPDELVQGRTFRAKCEGCAHTFAVAVPTTLPGPFAPRPSADAALVGQAFSDSDLAEISDGVGQLLPDPSGPRPAKAPPPSLVPGPEPAQAAPPAPLAPVPWGEVKEPEPLPMPDLSWPEPAQAAPPAALAPVPWGEVKEPGPLPVPDLSWPEPSKAAPLPPLEPVPWGEPEKPQPLPELAAPSLDPSRSPAAPLPTLDTVPWPDPIDVPARPATARHRGERAGTERGLGATLNGAAASQARSRGPARPGTPPPVEALTGGEPGPRPRPSDSLAEREPAAREDDSLDAAAPAPVEAAPVASAARDTADSSQEIGGLTNEYIIAAGTRHRHRWGIAVGAALLVACALAALLVSRLGRSGAARGHASPRAAAAAAASPASAPFDASSLAARQAPAAPSAPTPAAAAKSARRRVVKLKLDDHKLYDLLGKKDDVSMEAPADEVELDSAKDVLDPVAVERTVAKSRRAFDACVTKALRLNPGLRVSRRATLMVTVQPDGKVTGGWIAEEQIEGTELGRCLVTASSRMSFPSFQGEAIDVSIPLSLSAVQ